MQCSQKDNQNAGSYYLEKPSFSPFLVGKLKIVGHSGLCDAFYCHRHNMIVCCFSDRKIRFYDATTLLRIEGKKSVLLDGEVTRMSYDEESDIFIIGCRSSIVYFIYSYNASNGELKKLQKCDGYVPVLTFVDSRFYAFGAFGSNGLSIASLDSEKILRPPSEKSNCVAIQCLPRRKLLLSSFEDGFVRIYRTNKLPHLKNVCSYKVNPKIGQSIVATEVVYIKGKGFIITLGRDRSMKIWHLVKGRMRLLRVTRTENAVSRFVCLENYKMIATVQGTNVIKFWDIFSGKLKRTFVSEKAQMIWSLFLLKEKNMIGAVGRDGEGIQSDLVELIQLHPCEGK